MKQIFSLLMLLITFTTAIADVNEEKIKTYDRTYNSADFTGIDISHRYGPAEIFNHNSSKIIVKMVFKVTGSSEEAEKVLSHLKFDSKEDKLLILKTNFNVKNWNENDSRIKMVFQDNTKATIEEVEASLQVWIPKNFPISLASKYDEVRIGQLDNPVTLNIYDGSLIAEDLAQPFVLTVKYGKAKIGSFDTGVLKSYDTKLKIGDGSQLTIDDKYSEITLGAIPKVVLSGYDGAYTFDQPTDNLTMSDKYSEINCHDAKNVTISAYETDCSFGQSENVTISSKYSKYSMGDVGSFTTSSYEDEYDIGKVKKAVISSKYGAFKFGAMENSMIFSGYEDDCGIEKVTADYILIESKYGKYDLNYDSPEAIILDVNFKYGQVDFDKSAFNINYKTTDDDLNHFNAVGNECQGNEGQKLTIKGYENKVKVH